MIAPLIWRALPGPVWLRVLLALALFVGVMAALFHWVYPEVAPYIDLFSGAETIATPPGQ